MSLSRHAFWALFLVDKVRECLPGRSHRDIELRCQRRAYILYFTRVFLVASLLTNERKRLMLRACRLAHLSVGLSVCPESVLWQNG